MNPTLTLGVLSDTHIPDRGNTALHPRILPLFHAAGVTAILHAGDVTVPDVLERLQELAPVYAVKGNRDWLFGSSLPQERRLELGGVLIGLAHGHGSLAEYFLDKFQFAIEGYRMERYRRRIEGHFEGCACVVFGHTHRPEIRWRNGQLFFNPGPAGCPGFPSGLPSVGLLRIYSNGRVGAEITLLD